MHPNARKILLLLLHEKNIYKRRMSGQQKRQQMSCYKNLWFIASEPISFHYHQQHQSKFLVKIGLAIKSCHRVVLNLNYVTCGASLMHSMFFHFFVFEEKHHFPSVRNNEILDSSDDHKVQPRFLKDGATVSSLKILSLHLISAFTFNFVPCTFFTIPQRCNQS